MLESGNVEQKGRIQTDWCGISARAPKQTILADSTQRSSDMIYYTSGKQMRYVLLTDLGGWISSYFRRPIYWNMGFRGSL